MQIWVDFIMPTVPVLPYFHIAQEYMVGAAPETDIETAPVEGQVSISLGATPRINIPVGITNPGHPDCCGYMLPNL